MRTKRNIKFVKALLAIFIFLLSPFWTANLTWGQTVECFSCHTGPYCQDANGNWITCYYCSCRIWTSPTDYYYDSCTGFGGCCCGEGCFTGETEITVKEMGGAEETEEIKNLETGDLVSSFDPETGEVKESTVSDVTKTTREGYYILETESGKKVKVTAEHPFLAIKAENNQKSSSGFQTTLNKLGEIFSHTLTYQLITNIQTKLTEIF